MGFPGCEPGAVPFIEAVFHDCVYGIKDGVGFVLGMASILLWITAQLPQFIDNFKNQSAEALSVWFLAQWFLGDTLNLLGCLLSGEQLATTTALAMYFVLSDVIMLTQFVYYGALQRRRAQDALRASLTRKARRHHRRDHEGQALLLGQEGQEGRPGGPGRLHGTHHTGAKHRAHGGGLHGGGRGGRHGDGGPAAAGTTVTRGGGEAAATGQVLAALAADPDHQGVGSPMQEAAQAASGAWQRPAKQRSSSKDASALLSPHAGLGVDYEQGLDGAGVHADACDGNADGDAAGEHSTQHAQHAWGSGAAWQQQRVHGGVPGASVAGGVGTAMTAVVAVVVGTGTLLSLLLLTGVAGRGHGGFLGFGGAFERQGHALQHHHHHEAYHHHVQHQQHLPSVQWQHGVSLAVQQSQSKQQQQQLADAASSTATASPGNLQHSVASAGTAHTQGHTHSQIHIDTSGSSTSGNSTGVDGGKDKAQSTAAGGGAGEGEGGDGGDDYGGSEEEDYSADEGGGGQGGGGHWWDDTDRLVKVLGAVFGYCSTCLYLSSRLSQLYKNWSRKSAEGLSVMMFLFTISANVCTGMSILLRLQSVRSFTAQLPWICGAFGTVGLDAGIYSQATFYNKQHSGTLAAPPATQDRSHSLTHPHRQHSQPSPPHHTALLLDTVTSGGILRAVSGSHGEALPPGFARPSSGNNLASPGGGARGARVEGNVSMPNPLFQPLLSPPASS